ncbi:MAG TPA: hypothetical protein VNN13_03570 [Methylomirabilota bacterium]|nr:hypothetical protein [Methylomirabilota bacterium]
METVRVPINQEFGKTHQRRRFKKVLLIDPDKDRALSRALAQRGYDLEHCDSVREAWNRVYPRRPQLIILRLNNSTRGVAAEFRECRVLAEGVPILLLLSCPAKPALVKALEHGGAATLLTAPTPEKVGAALDQLERSTGKTRYGSLGGHSRSAAYRE